MPTVTAPWEHNDPDDWRSWWARQCRDEPVRIAASAQGFVLPTSALPALGVTRAAARHRTARGDWTRIARGVVTPLNLLDDDPDLWLLGRRHHALRSAAASLLRPGHVVSDRSAAVLHCLPTVRPLRVPQLTDPGPDGLGRRGTAHLFGATLRSDACTTWWGVPVTTAARTVVDLARHGRRDGIAAADAALRQGLATRAELDRAVAAARGWPGVRRARRIVAFATPKAESPLESIVRLLMHDDDMPPAEPQHWIAGYRVDLALLAQRLVVEADGRLKYEGDAGWEEKRREVALKRAGWRVERVLWSETTAAGWPRTSKRLWAAIQDPPSRPVWS